MSRIIEITPTGRTAYDMPDDLSDAVWYGFTHRIVRSIRAGIAVFPPELRAQVTITSLPEPERVITGFSGDLIIEDVFSEGTWETIRPTITEAAP